MGQSVTEPLSAYVRRTGTAELSPAQIADRITELEAERDDYRAALRDIADRHPEDAAVEPDWAADRAFEVLQYHAALLEIDAETIAKEEAGVKTRRHYADKITRNKYAEQVGVSVKTVKGWEAAGVVHPTAEHVGKVPVWVFSEDDVQLGQALRAVMRDNAGRMDLQQAREAALLDLPTPVAERLMLQDAAALLEREA